jgi:hypothetical protein
MQRLTNTQVQEFLKDWEENSSTEILEEGKKNEIIQIAKAKGIDLRKNKDLAGFKTIYTFANKANKNRARLPKEVLLKALPTMIGKPVDIDHNRRYVIGHYIDYRYHQKEDMVVAYGVFYKSSFAEEWEEAKKLFKEKKLATSYEIWCPQNKRRMLKDDTYELLEQEIAGGALLYKEQPAFEDAKVLELAKENLEREKDLIYASDDKYKKDEIIVCKDNKCELIWEGKDTDTTTIDVSMDGTSNMVEEQEKPRITKIKCSNCSEELDYNGIDVRVKCPKCFALLNKEGVMQYPPQIKDFKVLCPSCKVNNWLILSKKEDYIELRCQSCSREFKADFAIAKVDMKEKLSSFPFLYSGKVSCYQCNNIIEFFDISSKTKQRTLKCKKCGLEFSIDITQEKYKTISKIEELKRDKIEKSSKGGNMMEYKVELSKYHRYIDIEDTDKLEQAFVEEEYEGFEEAEKAKRLTYQERKNLPDSDFAVVARVKNKNTGEMRKIRMYTINDEAHVRNALARLGQPKPKTTLQRLGVSIEEVRRKVLARARKLGMTQLLERYKKASTEKASFICSCVECGYKITTDKHCVDLKCAKCGGQMRRATRPGDGKPEEKAEVKNEEPKVEAKTEKKDELTEAQKHDLVIYALEDKIAKYIGGIRKLASKVKTVNKELKTVNAGIDDKIKFYKENAKSIMERREQLGEFGDNLTDEQIMDAKDFENATLKKQLAEKEKIEVANEDVGEKGNENDDEFYVSMRKEINNKAFPKKK